MHLCFTMCFSSPLIYLLVATCHGSIINSYQSKSQPELHQHVSNNTTSISNNVTERNLIFKTDLHHLMSKNVDTQASNNPRNNKKIFDETNMSAILPHRQLRGIDDGFELPLPNQNGPIEFEKVLTHEQQPNSPIPSYNPSLHHHHHHHNDTDGSHSVHDYDDNDYNLASHGHESHHDHNHSHPSAEKKPITNNHMMEKILPAKHLDCVHNTHDHDQNATAHQNGQSEENAESDQSIPARVWMYSSLAVVIISLCGLFSVAVIPIMQKWFYQTLLQFLVGLAVGSLSGDGLLHLMPHAILSGEISHDHSNGDSHHHTSGPALETMEIKAIYRGLAALTGIFIFFIAERLLGALTTYQKQQKDGKLSRRSKNLIPVPREDGANNGSVGEKLAQPKKNSYDHIKEKDEREIIQMLQSEASPSKKGSTQSVHEIGFHGRSSFSLEPDASVAFRPDSESSVVISDHHGHSHGHSHEIPQSVRAVAWMVIMGDGLHNFCDGLAIGAAFASSEADGISTTVAVFCHELPHELGDFAMLLKTGMKVKQALFYNGLSSILCFIGMVIGVSLGNVHSATNWIFAGTAGMFLYIALVDMLPELSTPSNNPRSAIGVTLVQMLGIVIGISIMLIIALYEHELHSIVS